MLNDMPIWVFWPSIRILRITTDPFFGDHQLGMSHSSRSDLETSPLELVLSIDLSKVLPLGCFTVASRGGLRISLITQLTADLQDDATPAQRCTCIDLEWRIRMTD